MDITRLQAIINGEIRGVDLTANTPVVLSIKIGGGTNTELTKAILDNLVALQNGTDFSVGTNSHTHDGRYFTKTQLGSTTGGSSGAKSIGVSGTPTNYSPATPDAQAYFDAIDAALSGSGSSQLDGSFRIENTSDNTKKIAFSAAGITTATTRTITMPDFNVDLGHLSNANIDAAAAIAYSKLNLSLSILNGDISASAGIALSKLAALTNHNRVLVSDGSGIISESSVTSTTLGFLDATSSIQTQLNAKAADNIVIKKDGSVSFTANQPMGSNKLTGLAAGSTTGDSVRFEQVILVSGANAFSGNQDMGGNKITGAADPTLAQDLATKNYVDMKVLGLSPKKSVRVASTANITIASALINGSVIDGVTVATGDRVLLKDQTSAAQNGIYVVVASGAASRALDMDSLSPIDEINGSWVPVQEGTVQAGRVYVQYGTVATLGTDAINFEFYNPLAALSGGDMITVSGSTISVDLAAASGLESSNPGNAAGQLRIKLEASNPSLKFSGSNELAAKLDAAGAILSGTGGLAVQVDSSTIEINSNALRVKDGGITLAKMAGNSVDENKIISTTFNAAGAITGGSGAKVAVQVDGSSIEISSNALRIKSTAYDQVTITGGSGSAAAVQSAPAVKPSFVAGQTFAANTSYAVRLGITGNGETAGRIYAADPDTSSFDKFYVIGMISGGAGLTAGQSVSVVRLGSFSLSSSDTAFGSGTDGLPVFLTSGGALSTTAPTTSGLAVTRVGMVAVRSATAASNIVDVNPSPVGVN